MPQNQKSKCKAIIHGAAVGRAAAMVQLPCANVPILVEAMGWSMASNFDNEKNRGQLYTLFKTATCKY